MVLYWNGGLYSHHISPQLITRFRFEWRKIWDYIVRRLGIIPLLLYRSLTTIDGLEQNSADIFSQMPS